MLVTDLPDKYANSKILPIGFAAERARQRKISPNSRFLPGPVRLTVSKMGLQPNVPSLRASVWFCLFPCSLLIGISRMSSLLRSTLLLSVASLLIGCGDSNQGAGPEPGATKAVQTDAKSGVSSEPIPPVVPDEERGFETPEAAFAAYATAKKSDDYATYMNSITVESQKAIAGGTIFGLGIMGAFDETLKDPVMALLKTIRKFQASTGSSTACRDSTVNGFVSRKSAPVSVASFAVSALLSDVMNPKRTSLPDALTFWSNSMPFISGMFQSERTMSGDSLSINARASTPLVASTVSCPSKPACFSVLPTIILMALLSSTIRIFINKSFA